MHASLGVLRSGGRTAGRRLWHEDDGVGSGLLGTAALGVSGAGVAAILMGPLEKLVLGLATKVLDWVSGLLGGVLGGIF